ncbi:sulfite exporter TauE/SafE family protein [Methanolapillus millepedarum]|uniref:Probable membrane transporter protein n=1 Tax=Methanolapillus millepedarum TaxID=3028296 RepID=A0AA97A441_9EURY|nr:hypothetical protein MsAc7_10900 [Methanosarcinaceae archaeon Ac7]
MEYVYFVLLILGGLIAGSFAGMLGVGGAFLLVPLQFFVLTKTGYAPDIAMKVAIATALAVTLPTALNSAYRHSKRGTVFWKYAALIGTFGFLFSFASSFVANYLPGSVLSFIFGIVVLAAALRTSSYKDTNEDPANISQNYFKYAVCGAIMGTISGLTGIGGGIVVIPLMIFVLRFPFINAVGTSSATIVFTSMGGIIGYFINGFDTVGLPPYSVGYINILIFLILVIPSIIMSGVGASVTHRVNQKYIRYTFSILTFIIGATMIYKSLGIHLFDFI